MTTILYALIAVVAWGLQQPAQPPGTPAASAQNQAAAALTETYWKLTALGDLQPTGQVATREPHLVFAAAGGVAGHDGCNTLRGGYKADGEKLTFTSFVGTLMTCPGPDKLDRRFRDALAATRSWKISGDALTLLDEKGAAVARFEAQPDR